MEDRLGSDIRLRGRAAMRRAARIKLRDTYTCQHCGMVTEALEVDHVIPLAISRDDGDDNLQSLCFDCHALKTACESTGRASGIPEWLPKPLIPVTVVCGPPASGKSTYVKEHAGPMDLALDVDEIYARMTGCDVHAAGLDDLTPAIRYRNTILARLASAKYANRYLRCWLIATASTLHARSFWKVYASDLIVLDPGVTECVRRIQADATRPDHVKRVQEQSVRGWVRGSIPDWVAKAPKGCDVNGWPLIHVEHSKAQAR